MERANIRIQGEISALGIRYLFKVFLQNKFCLDATNKMLFLAIKCWFFCIIHKAGCNFKWISTDTRTWKFRNIKTWFIFQVTLNNYVKWYKFNFISQIDNADEYIKTLWYFRVRPEHVEMGIKLECTAAIGAVYWQSFQEKIPVVPRLKESTTSSHWWISSGASSSSFVQHANILLGSVYIW